VVSKANRCFFGELVELFKTFSIHFTKPNLHRNEKGVWFTIQLRKNLKLSNLLLK
jgi:hypothetical protein